MSHATTVLLTTYNRPTELRRLLGFWKEIGFDRDLIVLDSSSQANKEINRETCREHSGDRLLTYREFPETAFPFEKWHCLMREITTPYVIFAAEDDFLIPSALAECESFLDQNKDYAVCQGFHLSFRKFDNSIRLFEDSFTTSNEAGTPEERLLKQFSNYGHLTYGLRRMSMWNEWPRHIQDATESIPVEAGGLQEMIDAMLCLISGKMKRLPVLQSVRNGQTTVEDGWKKSFVFGPEFSSAIVAFKSVLIDALLREGKSRQEDYDFLLNECLKIYLGKVFRPSEKADLPANFPVLPSFSVDRRELKVLIEGSDFKLSEFKSVLGAVERTPLEIDCSKSDCPFPLDSSPYYAINWLNAALAVTSSWLNFNYQEIPVEKRNRFVEIIRHPRKTFKLTARLFGRYLGKDENSQVPSRKIL
jgi:glycosyltransferase domain-containing protein